MDNGEGGPRDSFIFMLEGYDLITHDARDGPAWWR
jgi:hypothetical protein